MRITRHRRQRVVAIVVCSGLLAAACGGDDSDDADDEGAATAAESSTSEPADGEAQSTGDGSSESAVAASDIDADTSRRLRLIGTNGVQHMDPVTGQLTCENEQLKWVYDSLIRRSPSGELVPGLAASWESPDPRTFVLHLREGAKFQDGSPFDADAVVQHLERAKTLPTSSLRESLSSIDKIEATDDFTVTLTLNAPRVGIMPSLFTERAGMVPSPMAVSEAGDRYGANGAVGAGPYAYDGHTPSADLHVSAWDGYWDAEHRYLAGIDMLGSASEFQAQRILDGEVDYAAMKDTQLAEAEQAKDTGDVDYKVSPTPQYAEIYINWNVEPFDDLRVRQALEHALDRELLAESLTGGTATPAYSPVPSDSWAHDPAVDALYPYDPAKAKELLAEAGYPDGVTVTVGQIDDPYYSRLAQAVQDMVKESGFTIEFESVTGAEISNRLYQLKDLPVAIAAAVAEGDPGVVLERKFGGNGYYNPAGTTADGVDELLADGAASAEQSVRAKAYSEAERLIMENALAVPLFWNGGLVAYVDDLKGVEKGYTTCATADFVSGTVYFEN